MALESGSQENRTEVESAESFLKEILGNGAVDSRRVLEEAAQVGISKNTLGRAKRSLGIKSKRVGGTASDGHWQFMLPTA